MEKVKVNNVVFWSSLALVVGFFFAISIGSLVGLRDYWAREEYSHAPLLPFISAFIGWHILARAKLEVSPSWLGVPVVLFSLLLSVLSEFSAFEALLNYSFIIGLFGAFLCFFGKKISWALIPVFILLFFAAPLPHIVYGNLSVKMQIISSTLGTNLIQLFGYSVFQDGNVIDLGHMQLQVVEACNGLRYLFPLMSLGYLIAYSMDDKLWKRVLVFLSVAPITIIMNSLRIAIVGVTVNLWGQDMAEGILHSFEGFVVFGVCLAILLVISWGLLQIGTKGTFRDEYMTLPKGAVISGVTKITPNIMVCIVLSFAGLCLFYSGAVKNRMENTPPVPNLSSFPEQIQEWTGKRGYLTEDEIESLDLTTYWMADYSSKSAESPVNFYVAYYSSQRMRANIHIPLNCIIGGGWKVERQGDFDVHIGTVDIPVRKLLISKNKETAVVYYWLEQRGRKIRSPLMAKIYLIWDSIIMHRTDGALVRVSTPFSMGENEQDADDRLQYFLQETYPTLESYIPGK